jgi:L-seryl-tRNA(Ser) seleniumtransferase
VPSRLADLIRRARRLATERDRLIESLAADWTRALRGQQLSASDLDELWGGLTEEAVRRGARWDSEGRWTAQALACGAQEVICRVRGQGPRPPFVSADRATLRGLPSVDQLLRALEGRPAVAGIPRPRLAVMVREALDAERHRVLPGPTRPPMRRPWPPRGAGRSPRRRLSPCGRSSMPGRGAPHEPGPCGVELAGRSSASRRSGKAYSNLELDLASKERGSRYSHVEALLRRLTGAEDALVVNNNAAACSWRSRPSRTARRSSCPRGELIEIGGEFRIPDIMLRSGAVLREVGATNRTHLRDYSEAIGPNTALLMKVHTSNYRVVGFTADVSSRELTGARPGARHPGDGGPRLGSLIDLPPWGFPYEPTVPECRPPASDLVVVLRRQAPRGASGRHRRRQARDRRAP